MVSAAFRTSTPPARPSLYEPGEKLTRMMQLLALLHTDRPGRTTRRLADELEVSPRTVQRYISTLQRAGLDIATRRVDGRVHWAFRDCPFCGRRQAA